VAGKEPEFWSMASAYECWIDSQGIPIHRGYHVSDLRTIELGWWKERQCYGAFLVLAGQEEVSEARVTEIPAGKTLPPLKFAMDEIVYVAEGRGLTTVWGEEGGPKKSFEWQKHSMFLIPRNATHQLSNMQGDRAARMLHYNYLPLAMTTIPEPEFFFNNPYRNSNFSNGQAAQLYSQAKTFRPIENSPDLPESKNRSHRNFWYGNFFPNMSTWENLQAQTGRGAGSHVVHLRFPNSAMCGHMSVFPSQTYKKAHRHGPGVVIVIPAGEGYSIMWPEGREKVVIPWQEASVFVPPNRWFHQHFNAGATPARYLAFHSPRGLVGYGERVEDIARDQIEYVDEEPWIRQKFAEELGKNGLKPLMPEDAYRDRNFEWNYRQG
jgi:oxalate decarboxylase/phosphoglucose isomerase-like protein (cupin superfamily)